MYTVTVVFMLGHIKFLATEYVLSNRTLTLTDSAKTTEYFLSNKTFRLNQSNWIIDSCGRLKF